MLLYYMMMFEYYVLNKLIASEIVGIKIKTIVEMGYKLSGITLLLSFVRCREYLLLAVEC